MTASVFAPQVAGLEPLDGLPLYPLRVTCRTMEPVALPENTGSAVRGALFGGVREIACVNHTAPTCSVCPLHRVCGVSLLLATMDVGGPRGISELAPLEALAQRFGRVNRKGWVSEAPVYLLTQPEHGQHIYRDVLVTNTLAVLRAPDVNGQPLDEARLSALLDGVYRDGLAAEFVA